MTGTMDRVAMHLLTATQQAALACQPFVGRGDGKAADGGAVAAMRNALDTMPAHGTVVIGEGEKDDAPMLYIGEELGADPSFPVDIAVDPLENTTACARASENAIAVIAASPGGSMWATPGWYMDKVIVGREAAGSVDITVGPEENVRRVAKALGKPVSETRVVLLDKPRHRDLCDSLYAMGASVRLIPDGDVFGALEAVTPGGGADVLVGIGGTPEGVITACAVHVLGGDMQAALAPQKDGEAELIADAGQEAGAPITLDELVTSADCCFVATAVTSGATLRAPARTPTGWRTQSLVISPLQTGVVVDAPHYD